MNYWLMKSEPYKYSWEQLLKDGTTFWDGVRNFQARNHLKAMKKGDLAFFYHSNEGLAVMGIMEIIRTAYPDPTSNDSRWVAVDVSPRFAFEKPVTLEKIKNDPVLKNMEMLRLNRLSVSKVTSEEFKHICSLGKKIKI